MRIPPTFFLPVTDPPMTVVRLWREHDVYSIDEELAELALSGRLRLSLSTTHHPFPYYEVYGDMVARMPLPPPVAPPAAPPAEHGGHGSNAG